MFLLDLGLMRVGFDLGGGAGHSSVDSRVWRTYGAQGYSATFWMEWSVYIRRIVAATGGRWFDHDGGMILMWVVFGDLSGHSTYQLMTLFMSLCSCG